MANLPAQTTSPTSKPTAHQSTVLNRMLLTLAWRNVWRNKTRSGIMIIAMVFGLMGVILMVGFINGMSRNMVENAIAYQTAHLQIHHQEFLLNAELTASIANANELISSLKARPEVKAVSARQLVNGMLGSANRSRGIRINGVAADDEAQVTRVATKMVEGHWLSDEGRNPIVVSRRSADKFKLRLGSKVVLTFSDNQGQVSGAAFRVVGFFNTPTSQFDENNVFVRRSDLSRYLESNAFHEIAIRLHQLSDLPLVQAAIANTLDEGQIIRDWQTIQPMLAAIQANMRTSNLIMLSVFVVALGFGIVNIMLMAVFERTRELGMLMAIGMTKSAILLLILFESLLLGLVGSGLGVLASWLMIAITSVTGLPLGALAQGLNAFGVDTQMYPSVSAALYGQIMLMMVVTSLLAALYPARQILKKRPVDAMTEKH